MKTFFRDSIFWFTSVLYFIYLLVFFVLASILGQLNTFNLIIFTIFFIEFIWLAVSSYLNNLNFKHIIYFLLSRSFNLLFPFYLLVLSNFNEIINIIFIVLSFLGGYICTYLLSILYKKRIRDSIFKDISNYLKAEGIEVSTNKDILNFNIPRNYPFPDGLILALRLLQIILEANSSLIQIRPNRVMTADYNTIEYELTFIAR